MRISDTRILWLMLAALWLGCFVGLSRRELWNNAEARVLLVAKDMVEGGSWLRPTMLGEPRYEKPPLMYWAVAGVSRLQGGLRESSAFWVSAFSLALAVLALSGFLARARGGRAGALAGLMVLSIPQIFIYGRQAQLDMLFMALCVGAQLCFAVWLASEEERSWLWAPLGGLALGLAALTKGPHALTFGFLPAVGYVVWTRDFSRKRWAGLGAALAVGLAPAMLWLFLAGRGDPEYLTQIRAVLAQETGKSNQEAPWYFLKILYSWALPWGLLAPAIWPRRPGKGAPPQDALERYFAIVFLTGFLLLSAIPGKQRHYIFPVVPALMAWVALRLDSVLARPKGPRGWRMRWGTVYCVFLALAAAAIGPGAIIANDIDIQSPVSISHVLLLAIPGLAAAGGIALALFKRRPALAFGAGSLFIVSFGVAYLTALIPSRNQMESPKAGCAAALELIGETSDPQPALFKKDDELLSWYLGGRRRTLRSRDDVSAWMTPDGAPDYILFINRTGNLDKDLKLLDGLNCRELARFKDFTGQGRAGALWADGETPQTSAAVGGKQ